MAITKESLKKAVRNLGNLSLIGLSVFGLYHLFENTRIGKVLINNLQTSWHALMPDGYQLERLTDEPPTSTPLPGVEPATPTPESGTPKKTDRMAEWANFWPDTAEEAAKMFGGSPADWVKNPDWPGDKKTKSTFFDKDYYPIEWKTNTQDADPNAPNYWPKSQKQAADYFFPGQNLDPKWMRQNDYGGWELMQDHWIDGFNTDMTATIRPGVVAEGYSVNGDDVAENDRNFVAWGGINNGINGGIAMPLAKGQGMTLWPPGTDPNKIGVEAKPYNIPYYTGSGGEQLGPNAINFTPIFNAPGFDILTGLFNLSYGASAWTVVQSPTEKLKACLPLAAGTGPARVTRPQALGKGATAFQQNQFKGRIDYGQNQNTFRA